MKYGWRMCYMIGFLMDENEKMRKLVMELLDYSKLEYQKENHIEDEMYGKYVEGAAEVTKAAAQSQTENGTVSEATGTNISGWAFYQDGQETYEVGSATQDARHFDKYVLKVLQEEGETLEPIWEGVLGFQLLHRV